MTRKIIPIHLKNNSEAYERNHINKKKYPPQFIANARMLVNISSHPDIFKKKKYSLLLHAYKKFINDDNSDIAETL